MNKGNEQAFPLAYSLDAPANTPGLTKRELFAAMAMQGMIQAGYSGTGSCLMFEVEHPGVIAGNSILFADALLAELTNA